MQVTFAGDGVMLHSTPLRMAKPKSEMVARTDELQSSVKPRLKALGFRCKGRAFNRATPDGLTEVVSFWMGPSDPPGTTYVPGLTENLYGKFMVMLGVFVPEVVKFHAGSAELAFIQEYHCCVRRRLGHLGAGPQQHWWELRGADAAEIETRLERDGLAFLERFNTRDKILEKRNEERDPLFLGAPPRIVAAFILAERGQHEEARTLLSTQARGTEHPRHSEYVRELAHKLGLGELDP
jgi:hypothetical protein